MKRQQHIMLHFDRATHKQLSFRSWIGIGGGSASFGKAEVSHLKNFSLEDEKKKNRPFTETSEHQTVFDQRQEGNLSSVIMAKLPRI